MNEPTVLYDAPGPRGRRRNRLLTVVFAVAFAAAAAWVVWALGQKGQWAAQKWKPFLQGDIWTVQILPGLVGTLKAAVIAAVTCSPGAQVVPPTRVDVAISFRMVP